MHQTKESRLPPCRAAIDPLLPIHPRFQAIESLHHLGPSCRQAKPSQDVIRIQAPAIRNPLRMEYKGGWIRHRWRSRGTLLAVPETFIAWKTPKTLPIQQRAVERETRIALAAMNSFDGEELFDWITRLSERAPHMSARAEDHSTRFSQNRRSLRSLFCLDRIEIQWKRLCCNYLHIT